MFDFSKELYCIMRANNIMNLIFFFKSLMQTFEIFTGLQSVNFGLRLNLSYSLIQKKCFMGLIPNSRLYPQLSSYSFRIL